MNDPQLTFLSASADATDQFARQMAPRLSAGDVILLSGEVGAGKSHFARCLIQSLLEQAEDVPSPTYTLVQTYLTRIGEVWHADLYRLTDISEVEELGLLQAFDEAICLVEWPDRLGSLAPQSALSIRFDPGDSEDSRIVTCHWTAPRWESILQGEVS